MKGALATLGIQIESIKNITIAKEEYAIQCEGHYLFAALTTNWLNTGETAAALAFQHSNDKSQAMKTYPVCTCLFATTWP
jgi:hypothetical protein